MFTFLQVNKYETDLYFLQNFQSKTMLNHTLCKICKHEIVFALLCRTSRTISHSQLLQNSWMIKQTVVMLWKYWKNIDLSRVYLVVTVEQFEFDAKPKSYNMYAQAQPAAKCQFKFIKTNQIWKKIWSNNGCHKKEVTKKNDWPIFFF